MGNRVVVDVGQAIAQFKYDWYSVASTYTRSSPNIIDIEKAWQTFIKFSYYCSNNGHALSSVTFTFYHIPVLSTNSLAQHK